VYFVADHESAVWTVRTESGGPRCRSTSYGGSPSYLVWRKCRRVDRLTDHLSVSDRTRSNSCTTTGAARLWVGPFGAHSAALGYSPDILCLSVIRQSLSVRLSDRWYVSLYLAVAFAEQRLGRHQRLYILWCIASSSGRRQPKGPVICWWSTRACFVIRRAMMVRCGGITRKYGAIRCLIPVTYLGLSYSD